MNIKLTIITFAFTTLATLGAGTHALAAPHPALQVDHTISYKALRARMKASMSESEWRAFKSEPLPLQAMRSRWIGEDQPGFKKGERTYAPVTYLHTVSARAPFLLQIGADGRLYSQGRPFDTRGELVNAVASPEFELFADTSNTVPNGMNLKHASFLAGAPTPFAIELESKNGLLRRATNRSGHHRMGRYDFMRGLVQGLEARKVDMSQLDVGFDSKSE